MEDPLMPENQFDNSASAAVPGSSGGGAEHAASGAEAGAPIGPPAEGESRTSRTGPRYAPSTVAHLGTAAARTTVTLSGRKLGEFQRVVRRAALVAIQTAGPRNQVPVEGPVPGARGSGPIGSFLGKPGALGAVGGSRPFESARAGQIADLVWNVVTVVTYSVARMVEVVAGPIERLIDPDPTVHDDRWLLLGPVPVGGRATGSFSLLNSAPQDAEVGVLLSNPPANTSGVIPVDRVVFRPQPATVPGGGAVEVAVSAQIPSSTVPGRYLGVVRSNEVPGLTLVLEIVVV